MIKRGKKNKSDNIDSFLITIKRTILQAEPVLGGKKLDLLRIYKTVMEAGGYEKVQIKEQTELFEFTIKFRVGYFKSRLETSWRSISFSFDMYKQCLYSKSCLYKIPCTYNLFDFVYILRIM